MAASVEIAVASSILMAMSFLCGICLLHYFVKFWRLRQDAIVVNRRGGIVLVYSACALVVLFLGFPLTMLHFIFEEDEKSSIVAIVFLIGLRHLSINPFLFGLGFFKVVRYWLIFYDIRFADSCLHVKWKQCINLSQAYTSQDTWYLQHRQKYGNQRFLVRMTIWFLCIVSGFSVFSAYLYSFGVTAIKGYVFVAIVIGPFLLIFEFIVYQNLPYFYDNIFLYREAQIIVYSDCCIFILYTVAAILTEYFDESVAVFVLYYTVYMTEVFVAPMVSSFWVIKQLNAPEMHLMQAEHVHGQRDSLQAMSLEQVLSDETLFDSFMQFMIHQLSMESVLALIEFTQYKQRMVELFDIDESTMTFKNETNLTFAESVPLSDIVYENGRSVEQLSSADDNDQNLEEHGVDEPLNPDENEKLTRAKTIALQLYEKYVADDAALCINVSYRTRNTLSRRMRNPQAWMATDIDAVQLAELFDGAIIEMYKLICGTKVMFTHLRCISNHPSSSRESSVVDEILSPK